MPVNIYDRLALGTLALVAVIAALTFRDYGLGWDDYTHSQYGELLLAFYASGFKDTRALSFVNLYLYGGGFDMAAALLAKILPFGLFETRRLLGAAVGILGLAVTWRIARRVGGPLARADRAPAARSLPALLRPHVHQSEGRAVRGGDGGLAARPGAHTRRISQARRGPACSSLASASASRSARASWAGSACSMRSPHSRCSFAAEARATRHCEARRRGSALMPAAAYARRRCSPTQ